MSSGQGGAANAGGVAFEDAIAAWGAVGVLAEQAIQPRWGLPGNVHFQSIRRQTAQFVDDLLLVTSDDGVVLAQAKAGLSCETSADSPFSSGLEQCVRQFLAFRHQRGTEPWERPLDAGRDRLVVVTDGRAPATVREHLPAVLRRFRDDSELSDLSEATRNGQERTAAQTATDHVVRVWRTVTGIAPSPEDKRSFWTLLRIDTFLVEMDGRDREWALDQLRRAVLVRPATASAAFAVLVQHVARLARDRTGADRNALIAELSRHSIAVRAPRSFDDDVGRLRDHSARMITALRRYARLRIEDRDIHIKRAATQVLEAAARDGHCLIIGEPGAGKSGVLHEFAERLASHNADFCLLSVEDVLRTAPRLNHDLVDVLANWSGDGPAYLLLDGLDAARSGDAARQFQMLVEGVFNGCPRWRVVASIRRYDLRYADVYQDQFRGEPVADPPPEPEFPYVRHLNVPLLTQSELDIAAQESGRLATLIASAREHRHGYLLSLLQRPFNLRLAASLLDRGLAVEEVAPLRSQIALLDRYWRERVISTEPQERGRERERLCRAACERMVRKRALRVRTGSLSPAPGAELDDLLREGVLVEWQENVDSDPDRATIAFAHNVLFDFAAERMLLRDDPERLVGLMSEDRGCILAIHPSFQLHFRYLWEIGPPRLAFWSEVLALETDAVPPIGRIIGPMLAAELIETIGDAAPLLDALDAHGRQEAARRVVSHLVGGLLASGRLGDAKDPVPEPWCELLSQFARRMDREMSTAVRLLVWEFADRSLKLNRDQARHVHAASVAVFDYALRGSSAERNWLMPAAIVGLSQLISADVAGTESRLRMAVTERLDNAAAINALTRIAFNIEPLIEHAPALAAEIYDAAFLASEPPNDPNPIWDSQIVGLVSNLPQDLRHIRYVLSQSYPLLLQRSPDVAIPVLGASLRHFNGRRGAVRTMEPSHQFFFRGRVVLFGKDYSCIWDQREAYEHEPAVKILEDFADFVRAAARDRKIGLIDRLLDRIAEFSPPAVVWKRLLSVGTEFPRPLGWSLVPLLESEAVLIEVDTKYDAARLLSVLFPRLSPDRRRRIELMIVGLPDHVLFKERRESGVEERSRLLGVLPESSLVTSEARTLLHELRERSAVQPNEPEYASVGWRRMGTEEADRDRLRREGIDPHDADVLRLSGLIAPVRSFTDLYTNGSPSHEEVEAVWPQVLELERAWSDASESVPVRLKENALGYAASACEIVARNSEAVADPTKANDVERILIAASRDAIPRPSAEDNASFDSSPAWGSPLARIEAAQGLMILAGRDTSASQEVLDAVERLANDPVNAVRFMVASSLIGLLRTNPGLFWKLADGFTASEESPAVANIFVEAVLQHFGPRSAEQAVSRAAMLFRRFPRGELTRQLRRGCLGVFLQWSLQLEHRTAQALLNDLVSDPVSYPDEIDRIPPFLREILAWSLELDIDAERREMCERGWVLLTSLADAAMRQWSDLNKSFADHRKTDSEWQPDQEFMERRKVLHRLLDTITSEILFAGRADEEPTESSGTVSTGDRLRGMRRFLSDASPVLDTLTTVEVVPAVHDLIQFLEAYTDSDPEQVFLRIAKLVTGPHGYSFESLAADAVVRIVEKYMARFRHVLRANHECQDALIDMLNVFVGWPRARRLTYRLGDVFR